MNINSKKYQNFYIIILVVLISTFLFSCNKNDIKSNNKATIPETLSVNIDTAKPTIKDFLSHAIEPLGTTLYIFGGGWAYDEEKGDEYSMSHGIATPWGTFFNSQNEWFVYKNSKKKDTSYFPFYGKNTHHEKGLDCTGYLGWLFYNTFEKEDSTKNYVYTTSKWLETFTNDLKLGTKEIPKGDAKEIVKHLRPSDIVVIDGHAYIVIGVCDDNSIIIIHSSVSNSVTGAFGGGVQLSAININNSENKNCKAYDLADYYMTTYFPEWHERYPTVVKPTWKYLNFSDKEGHFGIFHFDTSLIDDPDNLLNENAENVLKTIFPASH